MPALLARIAQAGRSGVAWFARRFPKTAAALGIGGAAYALTDGQVVALVIGFLVVGALAINKLLGD